MRLYRALLRLYPSGFRQEYRDELCAAFEERAREHTGPLAPLTISLAAVGDVVPNAIAAHWDILRQDLRYVARSLRGAPGFAITVVLVVALGIGANTAAFSLADFVLVRPLPFAAPDRLVKLWVTTPGYSRVESSPGTYRDWRTQSRAIAAMGAFHNASMNLVGTAEPRRLQTARVTPEVMGILGVPALAGRHIAAEDSTDGRAVVLSHALWSSQFGGDPGVLGSVVRLDGEPFTVVGIMPPDFAFPTRETEAWTPLTFREDDFADRGNTYLQVVGRLRGGATIDQAQRELADITARIVAEHPDEMESSGSLVIGLREEMSQRARLIVLTLCGAAFCILLLACSNLASMLLARAAHRRRELAVRTALGAGRERLVRQLVTESLALALIGGTLGVAVAVVGVPLLARLVPSALPVTTEPSVDLRVLAFAAALVVLTGLAFGVGPALGAARTRALDALREGSRSGGGRTRRVRSVLVVVEVAASVVLLVSSGLLVRAVMRIQSSDTGFRDENVLTLQTALPWSKYAVVSRREEFYARVLDEVRAIPGVERAAYVTGLPMTTTGGIWGVELPGREPSQEDRASLRFVTPDYFATLGIPLREGRDVAASDTRDRVHVAVVSESFVRRWFPEGNAMGKTFAFGNGERTIVGVVGDVTVRGREISSEPQVYLPSGQVPDSSLIAYPPKELVVRSSLPPASLLPAIRRIIRAADPEQPISNVRALSEIVVGETAPRVTQVRLLASLSAIALLIAGIGIHGLLAFAVSRRAQEIGVRRALGEQASSVVRRVLREGMMLALAGVAVGVAVAWLAARAMGALLAGVSASDPLAYGAAAVLCLVTAMAGCVRPAVRAARVDPIAALRGD